MADTKISALPASTTPLAGTEVLPIVQGGVTRQVSVANLTTGRAISATQLTLSTGNLVIGTAGKGIDFSATSGTGTSELLADYEEGTWTPTQGPGLIVVGSFTSNGTYTKIGRFVFVRGLLIGSTSIAANANGFFCGGLPFSVDIEPAQAINDTATGAAQMQASVTNIYNIQAIPAASRIVFNVMFVV
jgi:hypothetical protein